MLEAFSPHCEMESFSMEADAGGLSFRSNSKTVLSPGWRGVLNREEDSQEEEKDANAAAAQFKNTETSEITGCSLSHGKTSPKPLYTEATLLTGMQTCGKVVADEQAREAMKECGIGTPATRAAIISTLLRREYIERSGKSLLPTGKGLVVYNAVKDMLIADAQLTGNWEKALSQIQLGETPPQTFMKAIGIYTRQVTEQVLSAEFAERRIGAIDCPKCRTGKMIVSNQVAKCRDEGCGFIIFRKFLNKMLSVQDIVDICSGGKTALIKGFQGKRGKPFGAHLALDKNNNLTFIFPEDGKKEVGKSAGIERSGEEE